MRSESEVAGSGWIAELAPVGIYRAEARGWWNLEEGLRGAQKRGDLLVAAEGLGLWTKKKQCDSLF